MSVRHVEQFKLDEIWPQVVGFIENAMKYAHGEMDASQMRYALSKGMCVLFIALDDEEYIIGAAVVEFANYANFRVGEVLAMGGKGLAVEGDEFRAWLKAFGASYIECQCDDAHARLYRNSFGMKKIRNVMRGEL